MLSLGGRHASLGQHASIPARWSRLPLPSAPTRSSPTGRGRTGEV